VGCGKVMCWSRKAAISLKRIKIDKKLLRTAYRNSPTIFRTVPSPTPYGLLFPKIGGSQPPPRNPIAIMSGILVKLYGLQIWPVYSQGPSGQKPVNFLEKKERGRIQGLPHFWGTPYYLMERVKPRTSNFVRTFTGSIGTKSH